MELNRPKPQLHASDINTLYTCPMRYYYRHIEHIIAPPAVAMITGTGTHVSIEHNLNNKIKNDELLPIAQIKDIARDAIERLWDAEVYLTAEEEKNLRVVKADSVDMVVTLAELHAVHLAPKLEPKAVERKWVIELEGYPYDLAGRIDIEEITGTIRDTKTKKQSPGKDDADTSFQLSMYSLAKEICDGERPDTLCLDTLVKTKTPQIITQTSFRTDKANQVLMNRIERAIEVIEAGNFMPCDPSHWACSARFCGYHKICKYWSGKP